jgi:filamentous hemagglutinin family protein
MGVVPGYGDRASAQIIPDETLGNEPSLVTPIEEQVDRIDGGAIRGSNLFHSFREFNVGEGRGAYFANPAAIANIFSRVTGSNPSNILGTLGVLGEANLFVLNPNGILFGPNAKLDLKGSFLATTADSILFPEGKQFSATNPEAPPILTVNVQAPIGLQFEGKETVGRIENRSTAPAGEDLLENPVFGLRVPDDRSLLLVGGDIAIDGGGLNALGGRVELGGVLGNGTIGLSVDGNSLNLSFPEDIARSDISLSNEAFVNTSGEGGGSIQVQGKNVTLSDSSFMFADTLGSQNGDGIFIKASQLKLEEGSLVTAYVVGSGDGGSLTVNASESVQVIGQSANGQQSGLITITFGQGNAGNIIIFSSSLSLTDSLLLTDTFGQGNAGSVFIQALDSVSVKDNSRITTLVRPNGIGKGGDININAASLSVKTGSQLISAIGVNGRGDAGNINIDVTGAVTIMEVTTFPSGLFSLVSRGGVGNGGKITISANSFSLLDGANIFANTNGQGNGGTIQINANDSVTISGTSSTRGDSSEISARTNSSNRGGDIFINTRNFNLSNGGVVNAQTLNDGGGGNIVVNARRVEVINGGQILSDTSGRGNAGNITVNTTNQVIVDGIDTTLNDRIAKFGTSRGIINTLEHGASGFFVRSQGLGNAGDIEITSPKIQLDNLGKLFADSASGNGGKIRLQVSDLLLLRRGSALSTTAGTDRAGGDGGNITIDAPFIVAVPKENSNIQANAFEGNGGNINITTNGIFGIESRDRETLLSDITASSQFGREGQVEINTSGIDPTRSLTNLPQETVEAEVAQGCQTEGGQPKVAYFDIGRGGLPPTPDDLFNSEIVIAEWIPLDFEEDKQKQQILENSFTENKLTLLTAFPCQKSTQTRIN